MPEPRDVLADGRVDREKLNELLLFGKEQEALDFKVTVDFTNPKHSIEHIKDLLALMSLPNGGYLIVGVANDGAAAQDQLPIILTATGVRKRLVDNSAGRREPSERTLLASAPTSCAAGWTTPGGSYC